jgi:tetratricopeptide (TPR) repeat protein
MGAGLNRDAIKACQRCLRLHPRNADSLSMLGLLYVQEGEGAELGLSLCDRAISMDETEPGHWYRRSAALAHLDRNSEALSAVRTALQLKKNFVPAFLLRGRIYEGLGWPAKAGQSYKRVINMKESCRHEKKQARARLQKTP